MVQRTFADGVAGTFQNSAKNALLLGDSSHGAKGLQSLARAVKDRALDLGQLGVRFVLFEGCEQGDEMAAEGGAFVEAVNILQAHGIIAMGCESRETTASGSAITSLMTDGMQNAAYAESGRLGGEIQGLLDTRVIVANREWSELVRGLGRGVILYCGTSHLPTFDSNLEEGLYLRLGGAQFCTAYAIETPNGGADGDVYYPEQHTARFGSLPTIAEY